ncbi:hypothetical protein [Mycolicibacterium sp. S3B2]|uniref:hypothetical protein n=1 Tax=Mycolicibacterium sp. S3B2 TaxID=3415120 RepID=UPI003C7DF628
MTDIDLELINAARQFDDTQRGAENAELSLKLLDTPGPVLAERAAWLVRRMAGHLNSPARSDWCDADDDEADAVIDAAMGGIHHGGRVVNPNISRDADRAMTKLISLARERDDADRLASAQIWSKNHAMTLAIAYVGSQLVRTLAEFTGNAEAALDALQLEVMTHRKETTT